MKSYAQNVDRQNGLVRRVRICGNSGVNGYEYSPRTKKILKSLYEGFAVRWDHLYPGQKSSARAGFAVIRNVTDDQDALRGDLQLFYPQGTEEQRFLGLCEQNAKGIGFSHHILAHKTALKRQGKSVLVDTDDPTHIKLASVDLVEEPSTNHSIFESGGKVMVEGYTHILEQEAEASTEDWKQVLAHGASLAVASGDPEAHELGMKILKLLKPKGEEKPSAPAEEPQEEMKEQATKKDDVEFVSITESALDKLAKTFNVKPTASLKKLLGKGTLEDAIEILESLRPSGNNLRTPINQPRNTTKQESVPTKREELKARYA